MNEELSVFVDESGDIGEKSRYYLITLVFHEQENDISPYIEVYLIDLSDKGLPNIPMHTGPLLTKHESYEELPIEIRKSYLSSFRIFASHLPFSYMTFAYKKSEFQDDAKRLLDRMKRDLINTLFDNIAYLQKFTEVKVYYDNGQATVTKALHDAIEYVLAKDAIVYKNASPADYRLLQLADFLCTMELTAIKYQTKDQRPTDIKFFGKWGSFKKNYLNKFRRKRLN